MIRYKLKISYDGSNFSGYQKQKEKVTIQELLESALSQVLRQDISIVASGRTDAGVSAIEQVCHMDLIEEINTQKVMGYANSLLPRDIRIIDISMADDEFHARFSAKKKTYEYYFYLSKYNIPFYDKFASCIGYNVNIEDMRSACECFVGEHDFSAFCASNTNVVDKVRTIHNIEIIDISNNLFKLVVTGNGFLYNMVRIIMGTLIDVGLGKIKLDCVKDIIDSKDRSKSGKTAEAKGLVLKNVQY